jgi:uracil-DNA glycosylase
MHTEAAATVDFALDDRQRHMLEAMGIQVWQPEALLVSTVPSPTQEEKSEKKVLASAPMPQAEAPAASPSKASLALHPTGSTEQMDWPTLQSAVSACQACGLCVSRKNTVFGVGQAPTDALQAPQVDWLIVGEAPGENEDAQGEPFVGQAGKLLDNMLAAMKVNPSLDGQPTGLSRQQGVYIANVLKCRPPANRNPSPEEVAMCEPYLARQIELLRPKIILAMGRFAIFSLTGSNEPVGKLRGRVHALKHASYQAPVIVTYHPAYLLRNLPDKAKAWADLLLAMHTYRELSGAVV